MTYRGHVKNGVVVLEDGAALPEGVAVRVQPLKPVPGGKRRKSRETLGERLMKFAGSVQGLPSDMARNHDHYIHGTPRK